MILVKVNQSSLQGCAYNLQSQYSWLYLTYASTNILVTSSLAFPNTLVSRWQNISRHDTSGYFYTDKLLCSAVVFHFTRNGMCVLFPSGCVPTTVKQLFRCTATAYLSCSLSSSQNASNGSPTQGLHMHLYTLWPSTLHLTMNWLLGV